MLAAALALVSLSAASVARAQTLNLDAPAPPPPGAGKATLDLAAAMEKQMESIARGQDSGRLDGPAAALRMALRTLARNLLKAGEDGGEAGSAQVVAGRTLALRLDALDAHLAVKGPKLPPAVVASIVKRCSVSPEKLPVDAPTLWRYMRDALAPLVDNIPAVDASAPSEDVEASLPTSALMVVEGPLQAWAQNAKAPAEMIDACGLIDQRAALAQRWPAYASSLETLRSRAVDVLWLWSSPAGSGFPLAARPVLASQFASFVREACAAEGGETIPSAEDAQARGARGLRTLALIARCIELSSRAAPDNAAKLLREALVRLAGSKDLRTNVPADLSADALIPERLARIERLLRSVCPPPGESPGPTAWTGVDDVPRQLRPAIKPLDEARRQAAGELLEAAARAVNSPDVLSDPGFLQAMSSYQRRREDLVLATELTRAVCEKPAGKSAGGAWVVRPGNEAVGERMLLLARGIASGKDHDDAIAQWRTFAPAALLVTRDAELRALRTAVEDGTSPLADHVRTVTGGRAADLVTRAESARGAWLEQVKKARQIRSAELEAAGRTLTASRAAITLALEWARLRQALSMDAGGWMAPASDPGTALPGWELSAQAASVLAAAEMPGLAAGFGLAADGKFDEFLARSWERPGAAPRALVAAVAARGFRHGARALSDGAADALRQVAAGLADVDRDVGAASDGPTNAPLVGMSRYLEELAAAMARGDVQAEASLARYLQTRAAAVR